METFRQISEGKMIKRDGEFWNYAEIFTLTGVNYERVIAEISNTDFSEFKVIQYTNNRGRKEVLFKSIYEWNAQISLQSEEENKYKYRFEFVAWNTHRGLPFRSDTMKMMKTKVEKMFLGLDSGTTVETVENIENLANRYGNASIPVNESAFKEAEKKFCAFCGKKILANAGFCSYCGKKLIAAKEVNQTSSNNGMSQGQYSNNFHRTANEYTNKAIDLFNNLQNKVQDKIGDNDSRPLTHPFQQLGGFLAVLAYGWLITGIYFVWCILEVLETNASISSATGGLTSMITEPISLVIALFYGAGAFLCIKMFLMIQKKDVGFIYFYEMIGIVSLAAIVVIYIIIATSLRSSLGSYASYFLSSLRASLIPSLLISVVAFMLILRYFGTSVRVRTYFGTDDYLKRSIFLKNKAFPVPAVPDRV